MTTTEKTIVDLLEELHRAKWTDKALGAELGVTGQTVHRWRHEKRPVQLPKLVRPALIEILERDHD